MSHEFEIIIQEKCLGEVSLIRTFTKTMEVPNMEYYGCYIAIASRTRAGNAFERESWYGEDSKPRLY